MRHYCTLFDCNYLTRGLVLFESMKWYSSRPFKLHVLAMDEETFEFLMRARYPDMQVHHLDHFEKVMELTEIRQRRTWQEYCWTCASNLLAYLLHSFNDLTYLDADLMFFSDPETVFAEMHDRSIAITPHRFSAKRMHLLRNGVFNVGWVTVKNDTVGKACANRWAGECRDWCYYRNEGSRFADQKYLDEWPKLWGDSLHVIQNPGVNLAPWNMDNYEVTERSGSVFVDGLQELVFFHFHGYKGSDRPTDYPLTDTYRRLVYGPYMRALVETERKLDVHQHR